MPNGLDVSDPLSRMGVPSDTADATHWVVVGAGSAGCVVAARLSEDEQRSVTLVEAGPDLRPGAVPDAIDGPSFFEALALPGRTYPDLFAARTRGGTATTYQRGRGAGGSSAVNAMIALRGDPAMYAGWGWHDAPAAWDRVAIPSEMADLDELGPVDRALLAASPHAQRVPLTRRNGRRVTSFEAYLWPLLGQPNLTIRCDAIVDEVIIEGRRATGVRLGDGAVIEADHVVLAAGAIHSPAILLRSGVDTPGIGEGLQDHPSAPFALTLAEPVADPASALVASVAMQRGGVQVLPLNHLGAQGVGGFGLLLAAVMRTHGRHGAVRLVSPDPSIDPQVSFNLLEDERDLDALMSACRSVIELLEHDAFRSIVDAVHIDEFGTSVDALHDVDELRRWARSAAGDYVHASSTCAMGAVVDQDGGVVGYDRLYVCDASVFPWIPDVNTHLPTTMLAERLVARWRAPLRVPPVAG